MLIITENKRGAHWVVPHATLQLLCVFPSFHNEVFYRGKKRTWFVEVSDVSLIRVSCWGNGA